MLEHTTGTREEWLASRKELLQREKEHIRQGDELARMRRELPWVRIPFNEATRASGGRPPMARPGAVTPTLPASSLFRTMPGSCPMAVRVIAQCLGRQRQTRRSSSAAQ